MKLETLTPLLALAAAGTFLAAPAAAGSPRTEDPYSKQDESWISLSGEVESVARDYVDKIGTWFYASGVDEEDRGLFASVTSPVEPGRVARARTDACAAV